MFSSEEATWTLDSFITYSAQNKMCFWKVLRVKTCCGKVVKPSNNRCKRQMRSFFL